MANNFSGFPNSLGAWSTDNLLETYTKTGTIGADDNLPQEIRFLGGVAKLIRKRLAVENAKSDPSCPAIFLLKPNGPAHKSKEPTHVPMLDNGLTPITGRLWYLSPVVITGRYIDIGDYENDAELFQIIVDELKLGTIPAIIFDPRPGEPEIRFYKNGLSDAEVVDVILINRAQISLDNIFSTINDVYKKFLVTPDAQPEAGKLWVEPAKCWPIKNAENTIQLYLKIGLTMAFPTCVVRHEQTDVSGRLDLEIEESDPLNRSLITRHAILT